MAIDRAHESLDLSSSFRESPCWEASEFLEVLEELPLPGALASYSPSFFARSAAGVKPVAAD